MTRKKEGIMRLPEERKGVTCTHEPADWTECVMCVGDFYLKKLTAEQRARTELERPLAELGRLLQDAGALLLNRPEQRTSSAEAGEVRPPTQAPLAMAGLFDLVDIRENIDDEPGTWYGYGKVFSVLKDAPPFMGASPSEVLERILIAVINELEAQKVALEARVELAEKALGDKEHEAEELRARAGELRVQKDGAYAERNELAVLVATMARALGLQAGRRLDDSAEKGWQALVMVELPGGPGLLAPAGQRTGRR